MKFNNIYLFHIGKIMYQFKINTLPQSFNRMFILNSQIHSYNTRSSNCFHIPKCRTNIRKFSISYQGPKFFNSLSTVIQSANSLASFLIKLKTALFN